jgi:hypothetical protein
MVKYALLIGINYKGTSSELNGCVNDVTHMKTYLLNERAVPEANITVLTENSTVPTGINIVHEISKLVMHTDATELWLHYSGHGSYVRDTSGDERDGRDETIVPLDYEAAGMITDDMLNTYIRYIPQHVHLYCLFDSCHSGTVLDLKYRYKGHNKNYVENTAANVTGQVLMISGCMDKQTSADAYINNAYAGAMTTCFLHVVKSEIKCQQLIDDMCKYMVENQYEQRPQLCSSYLLTTESPY